VFVLCIDAGFKVVDVGCCPVRSDGQCIPNSNPCKNRTEYVFGTLFILPRLSTNSPQEDPTLLFFLLMLTPMISAI